MFSALNQGSVIYILDKTKNITYKIGEVVGITQPKFNNTNIVSSQFNNQTVVDIKVKFNDTVLDFNSIPSTASTITYNNGNIILSETKQGLQLEIESIIQNRKQTLEHIEKYKQDVIDCENILKEINPQFAKDKVRDEQITNLNDKVSNMENTLNKIVVMLSDKT